MMPPADRPPPSCLIPKQRGRHHYCFNTSISLAVYVFWGSMMVDDYVRGACNLYPIFTIEGI